MLWQRDWILLKHLHLVKGLILLLLLTVPWFYQVSMANDEFLRFFLSTSILNVTRRTSMSGRDLFIISLASFSSGPVLAGTQPDSPVQTDFSWKAPTIAAGFASARLIWVYIATVFIFFSLGHSKLPPYILPIFPLWHC